MYRDYSREDYDEHSSYNLLNGKVVAKYFSAINVRRTPSPSGKVLAVLKVGTLIKYNSEDHDGFYKVVLENGQEGYMMSRFIEEAAND